jgi:hypothetical protein
MRSVSNILSTFHERGHLGRRRRQRKNDDENKLESSGAAVRRNQSRRGIKKDNERNKE